MAIIDPSHPCQCEDGITPHIDSETGNWFIGEEDTGVHAQGPKGDPGECDCKNEKIDICHRPEGGEPITLNLPIPAALSHLAEHPNDTIGACPIDIVEKTKKDKTKPPEKGKK